MPLGSMAVTPVLTGPLPKTFFPLPDMMVLYPTSAPFTFVMAMYFPVTPSKRISMSLALGFSAEMEDCIKIIRMIAAIFSCYCSLSNFKIVCNKTLAPLAISLALENSLGE